MPIIASLGEPKELQGQGPRVAKAAKRLPRWGVAVLQEGIGWACRAGASYAQSSEHALDVHLGVMCRGTKGVVEYRRKGGRCRLQEAEGRQVLARSVDISRLRHAEPHLSSSPCEASEIQETQAQIIFFLMIRSGRPLLAPEFVRHGRSPMASCQLPVPRAQTKAPAHSSPLPPPPKARAAPPCQELCRSKQTAWKLVSSLPSCCSPDVFLLPTRLSVPLAQLPSLHLCSRPDVCLGTCPALRMPATGPPAYRTLARHMHLAHARATLLARADAGPALEAGPCVPGNEATAPAHSRASSHLHEEMAYL